MGYAQYLYILRLTSTFLVLQGPEIFSAAFEHLQFPYLCHYKKNLRRCLSSAQSHSFINPDYSPFQHQHYSLALPYDLSIQPTAEPQFLVIPSAFLHLTLSFAV